MTSKEILNLHPAPWRHVVNPGGNVVVVDAKNAQVQLFTMIEFVQTVTAESLVPQSP